MDLDDLKKLIEILKDTDVTDIEIEQEGSKVRIRREKLTTSVEVSSAQSAREAAPLAVEPAAAAAPSAEEEHPQRVVTITSPLVGTFYRSPSPEAHPFVEVSGKVNKGQVICIVEAMKLMNEIESELDGVVVKVLVDNAQPVEYGEPLFLVEPV